MDRKPVIIFAGTTEGRTISEYLASCKVPVTACVATEYGETLLTENEYLKVHAGRMDQEEIAAFIREKGAELVIDATHPYAAVVSENVAAACEREQVDYVRLIRGISAESVDQAVLVGSVDEAVEYLKKTEGNILATTGSKELFKYTQIPGFEKRVFARVLSTGEVAAACEKLGFVGKNLICMQGPFSEEMNIAMLHQFDCKYLVTKETGKAGGFEEKLHAAKAAGATLVLVGRPPEQKGYSYNEVLEMMRIRFHLAAASVLDVQPTQAKRKVTLVGIGIGTPEGMTVEAAQVIEKADLLVGADRMLAAAADKHKPTFSAYEPRKIGDYLELHPEYQRIVVLLSGDIGFYSGAKRLYEELEQRDFEVDALCGISSVVYFCGKLRTAWEDVCLLSTHGRSANLVGAVKSHHKTFTLLGKGESVHVLCQELMEYGLAHVTVHIGIQLGYEDEKILSGTPEELLKQSIDGLCVALIENETPFSGIRACVDDEEFSRGKAPMTKSEIRSLSVAKLQLPKDAVVYDVGAGTGSVTIELALAAVDGCIYAIERNQEACDLIEENKRKFGTPNIQVVHGLAPEAMEDLPAPTHAFIGGSAGNLKEIITCLLGKNPLIRLVINTVTLETMAEVSECLKALNLIEEETICVNVSRAKKLGAYHLMMGQNPIYIVTCRGGGEV
ncbi:precorrin-6A reductase [Clostridiaceae bacterium AF29-16BH]|nr:precorrin-6A reductase [Clostridiaceae bacterium AF29-16BH]